MTRSVELTDRLIECTLTAAEWMELESLLGCDPSELVNHFALLDLEGALRGLRTDFDLSNAILARVKDVQAEKMAQAVLAEIARQPSPEWARRSSASPGSHRYQNRIFALCGLTAAAAALLIAIWLGVRPTANDGSRSNELLVSAGSGSARLTSSLGSVELLTPQGEVLNASEGREVPPGHTLRTIGEDSLASVEMPDRTTVDIAPDSVVRFVGMGNANTKPRLFLAAGQLTAAVPEEVTDLQIIVGTSVAEVFARKGTFVVSSAGPESARVDIKQGKVDVLRMDARTRIPVNSGSALVQAGFEKVLVEPSVRIDRKPARTLTFPNPREAVFSFDGKEVWVASPRQLTRWTRDGGTADATFPPPKGSGNTALTLITRDKTHLVTSILNSSTKEEKVQIRTVPAGEQIAELNIKLSEARLWTVAPDASWIATADAKPNHKRLHIFDGATGNERFVREFEDVAGSLASSADGKLLATSFSDPRGIARVTLLDPKSGESLGTLLTQKKGSPTLVFSADGHCLAAGFNGLVQIWDVRTRQLVKSITGFERVVTCMAWSKDEKMLATGMQDGQIWIWSVAGGKVVQLIDVGSRGVRSIGFSPSGKRLVAVANNALVGLWDIAEIPPESTDVQ